MVGLLWSYTKRDCIHEHFRREVWWEFSVRDLFVCIGVNNVESGLCDGSNHTHGSVTSPHMEMVSIYKFSSESNPEGQSGTVVLWLPKCSLFGFTIILKASLNKTMCVMSSSFSFKHQNSLLLFKATVVFHCCCLRLSCFQIVVC